MAPKFIIATRDHYTGYLKFGLVDLHSDLKSNSEAVYGGGKYEIDNEKKTLKLTDKSFDFGLPVFDGWETLKISADFKGYRITYTYPYDPYSEHSEETIDLTKLLTYDEDL